MRNPSGDADRGNGARRLTVLLAGLCLASLPAVPAEAQIVYGAHAVHAADAFGGSTGAGLRAGLDLPVLPFDLMASGEYFFPDCPTDLSDCGLKGLTLDANFRMVLPVVRPYVTGGLAWREISVNGVGDTSSGIALGAGLDLALGGTRAFGEVRYEFVNAPEKQFLWRLGILFGG